MNNENENCNVNGVEKIIYLIDSCTDQVSDVLAKRIISILKTMDFHITTHEPCLYQGQIDNPYFL